MATELGNTRGVVTGVYLAVLLPWAFLYYHDFISERWCTIRRTFSNGIIHIIVITIPMPFIIYYIILQQELADPDFKEMYAAITALVLSVYHLARTIWGLIQLHHFRRWAINAAIALETASYKCALNVSYPDLSRIDLTDDSFTLLHESKLFDKFVGKNVFRPFKFAIDYLRRHFLIRIRPSSDIEQPSDPTVSTSEPRCQAHDLPDHHQVDRSRIASIIDKMMVNSSIVDNEFTGSSAPYISINRRGELRPRKPEILFVRWAIAYLSQFGKQWLQDSKSTPFASDSWESRRHLLATEVWGTSVLRMETECMSQTVPSYTTGNKGQKSFLSPHRWSHLLNLKDDQLFNMNDVLRKCFMTGKGLPYECPLLQTEDDPLPPQNLYIPLIKEACSHVPFHLFDFVDTMTPSQIEWFAIFISVGEWCGCSPHLSSSQDIAKPENFELRRPRQRLKPSDAPIRLLQNQLGLVDPPTLKQCAYPFNRGYGKQLWDNRGILQVSARVDNWLSLAMGHQLQFLLNHRKEKGRDDDNSLFATIPGLPHDLQVQARRAELEKSEECDDEGEAEQDIAKKRVKLLSSRRSKCIFEYHKSLENNRLRYQLADLDTRHFHLEQGLSFMGCVAESVRSEIAEFCYQEKDGKADSWFPEIPETNVSIIISLQLSNCLRKIMMAGCSRSPDSFDSTIQERLLWECQNGIHEQLQLFPSRSEYGTQKRIEAMMLLLMGFPTIQVEHSQDAIVFKDNSLGHVFFKICPTAGPQPLEVLVKGSPDNATLDLRIVVAHDQLREVRNIHSIFRWQDWRDAFEGRLSGKREWHRKHYMRHTRLHHTSKKISCGIISRRISHDNPDRMVIVWEGWWPFRVGMALFELKHCPIIIVGDSMPLVNHSSFEIFKWEGPQNVRSTRYGSAIYYEQASISALSDASLHLDTLLNLTSSLAKTKHPRQSLSPSPRQDVNALRSFAMPLGENIPFARFRDLRDAHNVYQDADSEEENNANEVSPDQLEDSPCRQTSERSDSVYLSDDVNHPDMIMETRSAEDSVYEDEYIANDVMLSPSSSPESSHEALLDKNYALGNIGFTAFVVNPKPGATLINRVKQQNPLAMHDLARHVLHGTNGQRKNRARALVLMERSIVLGRHIDTLELFVKTILNEENNNGGPGKPQQELDIDRALKYVRMMWRDIEDRHISVIVNKKMKKIWKNENRDDEVTRKNRITKVHSKLIRERRTGEMMSELGDRLSMWSESETERQLAIVLYESAIVANCDLKAMNELAVMCAAEDMALALGLYMRVERMMQRQHLQETIQDEYHGKPRKEYIVKEAIRRRAEAGDENASLLYAAIEQSCSPDPYSNPRGSPALSMARLLESNVEMKELRQTASWWKWNGKQ